jgi:hypothetical protein
LGDPVQINWPKNQTAAARLWLQHLELLRDQPQDCVFFVVRAHKIFAAKNLKDLTVWPFFQICEGLDKALAVR